MEKITVRTPEAAKMLDVSEIWLKKDRAKENPVGPPHLKKGKIVLYTVSGLKEWAR